MFQRGNTAEQLEALRWFARNIEVGTPRQQVVELFGYDVRPLHEHWAWYTAPGSGQYLFITYNEQDGHEVVRDVVFRSTEGQK